MTTTDQPQPMPPTNIVAQPPESEPRIGSSPNDSTAAAMEQPHPMLRRFFQGAWILGRILEVFSDDDDNSDRMTWREASGKPPRQRRSARRRNRAD